MESAAQSLKVAAVQAPPVFLDVEATIAKAISLIAEAAANGARLIVFPEAFVPAYPDWVWVVAAGRKPILNDLYARLWRNSISIPDTHTEQLCAAARDNGVYVAIGINERNSEASGASLFNTMLYIDPQGEIMGRHRKLVPTGGERLVWAPGDGSTLDAFDTPYGPLGGLICWENYMPTARYHMYRQGVRIYTAATWDSGEVWLSTLRHIAKEGGMFVIGCCMALRMSDIPDDLEFKSMYPAEKDWINPGKSCIVGPSGQILAGPMEHQPAPQGEILQSPTPHDRAILYADLDLGLVPAMKWMLDTAGHYDRPDVFELIVHE